jgi:hypothetical protein
MAPPDADRGVEAFPCLSVWVMKFARGEEEG